MSNLHDATLLSESISIFEHAADVYINGGFSGKNLDFARNAFADALCSACAIVPPREGNELDQLLSEVEKSSRGQRDAALLLMRALAVDGLLPVEDSGSKITRILPALVEKFAPDITKQTKTAEKRQNFEKIKSLKDFHGFTLSNFNVLTEMPSDLVEIDNITQTLRRPFANKLFQAYLQPYGFNIIKGKIESILDQVSQLVACKDARYKSYFDQLSEDLLELRNFCFDSYSFFTDGPIKNFVNAVQSALAALQNSASERFYCELLPKRKAPRAAEKRYPLHEVNRYVTFKIPMENIGPGVAVDVSTEIDCGRDNQEIIIEYPQQRLGDIPPGDFAILISALIVKQTPLIRLAIQLEWRQLFGKEASYVFNVEIEAQDPSVDWSSLEALEPYSLEVAEGETFVGRVAKLKSIANRLLRKPMSSTYITGQKRVGKTSLARAAVEHARSVGGNENIHYLYLEYGEYCSASPEATVKALGDSIFFFLQNHLSAGVQVQRPDFIGSLAQLNNIVKLLESQAPLKRFVIVLDEFDEIHPEMYRLGSLAETFFANIRTLASRANLAFILVGGEKMPFIIGAQGDQLNKFVREPLDYFSRSTEWEEYCKLVTKPVMGRLNWDEAAIAELFNATNGHPYYTNLLCSKIVAIAVVERDTEIIVSDVRHAMNVLVSELDTNAFAHMWKDGINAEREEAEVTELKRLRFLVALGRALRNNERAPMDVIKKLSGVRLPEHEGTPLLEDFMRRNILREKQGQIFCNVFLFEKWLIETGVTSLIASTLADDLEVELQHVEDNAFVSAGEIQLLAEKWPLYQSRNVGPESIRAWLDQTPKFQEQRLLFKLLQNVQFIRAVDIEQKLETAHSRFVLPRVGALQIEKRTDKRRDVWLTYVGGPGKSGTQYARMYAKANSISTECIIEPTNIEKRLRDTGAGFVKPKAILIIDDVVGSGKTMSAGITSIAENCGALLANLSIPILAIVMVSTEEGEKKILTAARATKFCTVELHVCEYVSPKGYAFPAHELGIWATQDERDRAKALCIRLGTGLYKDALGYGGQGLLLVMPDTCPNNSLPILYKSKEAPASWRALFPRPTT
jgi:hypothetical protein